MEIYTSTHSAYALQELTRGTRREETEGEQANGWHRVCLVEWHLRRDEGWREAT